VIASPAISSPLCAMGAATLPPSTTTGAKTSKVVLPTWKRPPATVPAPLTTSGADLPASTNAPLTTSGAALPASTSFGPATSAAARTPSAVARTPASVTGLSPSRAALAPSMVEDKSMDAADESAAGASAGGASMARDN
jgi:hypothetical protein